MENAGCKGSCSCKRLSQSNLAKAKRRVDSHLDGLSTTLPLCFALARLLCADLLHEQEPLHPAFSTATYRQKTQKAFAAELLCPYDALKDFLGNDFSNEKQQTASEYFNVSERTVESILKNHGDIERSDADEEMSRQAICG